jgi:hypothetical protein
MKHVFSTIYHIFSFLTLLTVFLEFFFAGMGVFHAASFQIHRITGILLLLFSVIMLLVALIGRIGRQRIGFTILLLILLFIQPLLLQVHQPFVEALHPVNGLIIMFVCAYLILINQLKPKEKI